MHDKQKKWLNFIIATSLPNAALNETSTVENLQSVQTVNPGEGEKRFNFIHTTNLPNVALPKTV